MELPPDRPAGKRISFTYSYDENQIMNCVFKDLESGETEKAKINMTSKDHIDDLDEEIEKFMVE